MHDRRSNIPKGAVLVCSALLAGLLVSAKAALAQSCGDIGGDYCSQSGGCPGGYDNLGQTYDCNPCCREQQQQGPSCGAIGGDYCSQSGSCPGGYDNLGQTYDCNPCCDYRQQQGQMSFSVYADATVDSGGMITMWTNVEDHSSGCNHSGYSITARIVSPTGRVAASTSGGLSAVTSMSIGEESGNYAFQTSGQFYCSCAMIWAGFGGGWGPYYAGKFYGRYYNYTTLCPDGKNAYLPDACNHRCMVPTACSSAQAPYLWDVGYFHEFFGFGACKHDFQGSNNRGLCSGP
jgi:hypothetical protein